MKTMHLFAGGGGGLYADLILGHTPIVAVEWDPYACAVLRSRAADGWFPGLQVWEGDVRLFDPSQYTGKVDCISAGFPCTDISTAGRGEGINGERSGLYREILRVADIVRPRFLFLENSPAITCRGLGQVLGELAERGYDARWTCLSAGEVGANHERSRWWCIAERNVSDSKVSRNGGRVGNVCKKNGRQNSELFQQPIQPTKSVPISEDGRVQEKRGAGGTVEFLPNAYNPDQYANQRAVQKSKERHDSSGMHWWETEPDVCRLANGVALVRHQLKCLGNGQVPLCAAAAWKILFEEPPPTGATKAPSQPKEEVKNDC